ncbi:hypothetical protein SISSUDRAFT_1038252 [Sistotremastrum suecicum HHB10207 ss-3]|uniref:Uncharacterized protein n=1 Tax=Sistotremastrum suecicum HHB10207 ss-3 TaxID=1314776 RepID=A0A165X0I9_9AGAM|nr:hypothetical protein SISSUDRAFT_1038252 [Sistotremastrum suecicum HHB10207 ss-3]
MDCAAPGAAEAQGGMVNVERLHGTDDPEQLKGVNCEVWRCLLPSFIQGLGARRCAAPGAVHCPWAWGIYGVPGRSRADVEGLTESCAAPGAGETSVCCGVLLWVFWHSERRTLLKRERLVPWAQSTEYVKNVSEKFYYFWMYIGLTWWHKVSVHQKGGSQEDIPEVGHRVEDQERRWGDDANGAKKKGPAGGGEGCSVGTLWNGSQVQSSVRK